MRTRVSVLVALSCLVAVAVVPSAASAHGTHLKAKMSGDQVVGQAGAPNGTGRANIHLLKGKNKLCFEVQWDSIGNKQGLNIGIYEGREGRNGNEILALVTKKQSSPIDECIVNVPTADLKELNQHPEDYHVNIKNKKYPRDGAIRGQLKAV
jgi:CHRD domain